MNTLTNTILSKVSLNYSDQEQTFARTRLPAHCESSLRLVSRICETRQELENTALYQGGLRSGGRGLPLCILQI